MAAAAPFRALPPGVYFNPTAEECVRDYLKPWAAARVPPATDRVICDVDVYSDSPGALLLGREPGFSRGFDHKWLLLSNCGGGGRGTARGKREVATGGRWRSEQTPKGVVGAGAEDDEGGGEDFEQQQQPHGGRRRSFGFYLGKNGRKRGEKMPWLMEEFTALDDGHGHGGGGGDGGAFVVFCRIYLTPRLDKEDKEKKRQILGDDLVAFDRNGKLKPVRVVVSPEFFHALAQGQCPAPPPPRVLGFQQAQPAPPRVLLGHQQGPPPPPPRVLGFQQAQTAYPPPLLRFLGHQAAATPAVLGDHHHGSAMLPRAVPAHHDGQAMLPWGVPAHHQAHAAGAAAAAHHQGFLGLLQGQTAVEPQQLLLHVLDDPCYNYNQEASPSVRLVDPQQGKAMTHTEKKKPRLAYGSPASKPQSSDSGGSCVVHVSPCQEQGVVIQIHDDNQNQCSCAEPVAPTLTLPPQGIPPGTAMAEPPCYVSAAPAPASGGAGKAAGADPMADLGVYVNLADFEPFLDGVPDFLVSAEFNPPYDDGDDPPPLPGFDEFQLVDFDY